LRADIDDPSLPYDRIDTELPRWTKLSILAAEESLL
jgi:hypothetical protein